MTNRILRLILSCLAVIACTSSKEQAIDTLKVSKHFPVKNGYILKTNYPAIKHFYNQGETATIFENDSKNDSVFSISKGEVISKIIFDSINFCTIKSGDFMYLYALSNCSLKEGDFVNEGVFIGNLNRNEQGQKYVDMQISYKNEILSLNKTIKILSN